MSKFRFCIADRASAEGGPTRRPAGKSPALGRHLSPIRAAGASLGLISVSLCGCTSATSPTQLGLSLPTAATGQIAVSGTALSAYSAIARGALVCWVGAQGPLKATHIFHADVAPPASGGAADIVLHQRDPTQPSPRGAKALHITVTDSGSGDATIVFENLKLPVDLADAMYKDTLAWARESESCEAQIVRPPPSAPPSETPVATKKLKKQKASST
jgi:hypothetical protein